MYSVEYVNRLWSMLDRHLHLDHKLFCFTDDLTGVDDRVTTIPMPPDTFPGMTSPSGKRANFRRLRTFDKELVSIFGPRMVSMDIDVVIVDDITPVLDRPEPLVCFDQMHDNPKKRKYNTSLVLLDTGILGHMWTEFVSNPSEVWTRVKAARIGDSNNSDQAVFGYYARDLKPATWSPGDGVWPWYKVRNNDGGYPPGTRIVLFFGDEQQHEEEHQKKCPWITEHWR